MQIDNKIMSETVLSERKKVLRKRLISAVTSEYVSFIGERNLAETNLRNCQLHPLFDAEKVRVEGVKLKEAPMTQRAEKVEDYIKKSKRAIQEAVDMKMSELASAEESPSPYLSKRVLRRCRMKRIESEETRKVLEQRAKESGPLCERDAMLRLAETLKAASSTQRNSLIPLELVVDKLVDPEGAFCLSRGN